MGYTIVKTLRCITNELLDDKGYVKLTVGDIYDSVYCNSTPTSNVFGAFNDEGDLQQYDKRYFEVVTTNIKENTGWEIKCKDCYTEIPLNILIKNNFKCHKCGQKFSIR